jgi:choline monooxygenase
MSTFEIDPDIRKAHTLASEFYTDERYFEESKEKIFARTWQFAGRTDDVNGLVPFTLLPRFLDEPLLLVKDPEGVKCISNVCTHRGKILVEEPCQANLIRCGYHGRRFSLDGKFLSMPEFEDVEDFPAESDNLCQVPLASRGGFLFAALDPIADFGSSVNDAAERLEDVEPEGLELASIHDYEVNAHWALYCENYLEGFHIPYVHRALNEIVDYGTYTTETFRYSSLQMGFDSDANVAARYLFLFPNMMFNFYPWGISVNIVLPVSPSKSVVKFLTYVRDAKLMDTGAGAPKSARAGDRP